MKVDLTGYVNAYGKPITTDPNSPSFVAKPKPKREAPASFHRGWVVEGHKREEVDEAERLALQKIARWDAMPSDEKAAALIEGKRPPPAWDRDKWMATHKLRKLRNKPFEIPQAAEQFAEMCRSAGFLCVTVTEVKREQVQRELA